jgi:hypothetical protein
MKRRVSKRLASQVERSIEGLDREFTIDSFSKPPAAKRALFEAARRKPGRPKEGRGAHVIAVSVERELLERSDELAKELGITRARLIARGLKAVLAAEGRL